MFSGPRKKSILATLCFTFFAFVLFSGCQNSEPIKIGFSGGLTGRLADLGLNGRNGVILAVEEINRNGGVAGRQIELLIRDDRQDPDVARTVDEELITKGSLPSSVI